MKGFSEYGLMSFRASAIYFMIIQGFGYLLGLEYNAMALFGVSTVAVVLFNIATYFGFLGICGFMDEREMEVATTAAAYGLIVAIFAISLDQGQILSLSLDGVGQAGFGVFLAIFLGKNGYHRLGDRW